MNYCAVTYSTDTAGNYIRTYYATAPYNSCVGDAWDAYQEGMNNCEADEEEEEEPDPVDSDLDNDIDLTPPSDDDDDDTANDPRTEHEDRHGPDRPTPPTNPDATDNKSPSGLDHPNPYGHQDQIRHCEVVGDNIIGTLRSCGEWLPGPTHFGSDPAAVGDWGSVGPTREDRQNCADTVTQEAALLAEDCVDLHGHLGDPNGNPDGLVACTNAAAQWERDEHDLCYSKDDKCCSEFGGYGPQPYIGDDRGLNKRRDPPPQFRGTITFR